MSERLSFCRLSALNLKLALSVLYGVAVLLSNLWESHWGISLRLPLTLAFLALFVMYTFGKKIILEAGLVSYLVFTFLYLGIYILIGPKNNLAVHVYTLIFASLLLYQMMMCTGKNMYATWRLIEAVWLFIYASILFEVLLVACGWQPSLYDLFPAENFLIGLPGYRYLHNTFANFLDLNYLGLNSILLSAQGFGQFCAMLIVFGVRFSPETKRSLASRQIIFILLPLLLLIASPNLTAMIMAVCVGLMNLCIRQYIGISSLKRMLILLAILSAFVLFVYFGEFGFIRTYNLIDFYVEFVEPQLDYVAQKTLLENFLGVNVIEFTQVSRVNEVGLLTYASAVGPFFIACNLILVFYCVSQNLRQIKYLYRSRYGDQKYLEIQIMNILLLLSMLLSAIHFPVLFSFAGSLLFALNVAYCLLSLKRNKIIITSAGHLK